MTLVLSSEVPELKNNNVSVYLIPTKAKTTIPLIVFRYPGATMTLIFSHGNATDCGAMCVIYSMLSEYLKINVVGYDYTGYGASTPTTVRPTEKQTYKDIEAVYDWCIETKLVTDPGAEIILYGQSVGSGPSTYLASKKPVAGLVLHSPIMSGLRVVTQSRLLGCCDIFPNIQRITNVKAPVFVIHGQVHLFHG